MFCDCRIVDIDENIPDHITTLLVWLSCNSYMTHLMISVTYYPIQWQNERDNLTNSMCETVSQALLG